MDLPGEVRVVENVAASFAELVLERQPKSIALSGAWLARDCYSALRGAELDWSSIEVFFGDERFVPIDSPDSNEGQARRVLLDHVAPRAVHSMYANLALADAANAYDALIRRLPPIDLIHLGVGPDGHTASLFPHTDALGETTRFVVPNADAVHPHPRLTFTFAAIARSPLVVVAVSGSEKREAIARIRAGEDLPAARIRASEVVWLLDRDASDGH
ncbi:MAG: 6-phosphogluconolactonase [Actinomycetota bacterium]|nr:6-phosphogluconolactonase [Actinomycetota bacterium]